MARASISGYTPVNDVYPTSETLSKVIATDSRLAELRSTLVVPAVQLAREGCFISIYPPRLSIPCRPLMKWVWLDSEKMSVVWENEDGVPIFLPLRDVKWIATGDKSRFLSARLSKEDRSAAFEIRCHTNLTHTTRFRRHYRMLCHDARECTLWIVALSIAVTKASKISSVNANYQSDAREPQSINKKNTLVETTRKGSKWLTHLVPRHYVAQTSHDTTDHIFEDAALAVWNSELRKDLGSLKEVMRLLAQLSIAADVVHVQQLFNVCDTDGSGLISSQQFLDVCQDLLGVSFLRETLNVGRVLSTAKGTFETKLSINAIKLWLQDNQYESGSQADLLIADIIDCNKSHLCNGDEMSYAGFLKLLKLNGALNSQAVSADSHELSLPLTEYWVRASDQPFGSLRGMSHSDLAMSLRRTIDLGVRCFPLTIQKSPTSAKFIVKPNIESSDELLLTNALGVIKACAFSKSKLPIIILLDITEPREEWLPTLNDYLIHELGPLLCRTFDDATIPTLQSLANKIVLALSCGVRASLTGNIAGLTPAELIDRVALPPKALNWNSESATQSRKDELVVNAIGHLCPIKFSTPPAAFSIVSESQFLYQHRLTHSRMSLGVNSAKIVEGTSGISTSIKEGLEVIPTDLETVLEAPEMQRRFIAVCKSDTVNRTLARSRLSHLAMFNGANLCFDSSTRPSYVSMAVFPNFCSFMPKNKPPRPCRLDLEVIGGHMLPQVLRTRMDVVPTFHVDVKLISGTGLVYHQRAVTEECGPSPRLRLALSANLSDEHTSMVAFEVFDGTTGAMLLVACRVIKVDWLTSGLRWVPLRDTRARAINWSGLWIKSQKQLQGVVPSSGPNKLFRFARQP